MGSEQVKSPYSKFFYGSMLVLALVGVVFLFIDVPAHDDWSAGLCAIGLALGLGVFAFAIDTYNAK